MYKVLIVDDSYEWIKFHRYNLMTLFPQGLFEITTADCAAEGIQKVKESECEFDLIISDLQMEMIQGEAHAGMWMIKTIQKNNLCPNSKIIIISASYDIKDVAEFLNVEHIPKGLLVGSPNLLQYKVSELLNIEIC